MNLVLLRCLRVELLNTLETSLFGLALCRRSLGTLLKSGCTLNHFFLFLSSDDDLFRDKLHCKSVWFGWH